jgi:hypothetical protein
VSALRRNTSLGEPRNSEKSPCRLGTSVKINIMETTEIPKLKEGERRGVQAEPRR